MKINLTVQSNIDLKTFLHHHHFSFKLAAKLLKHPDLIKKNHRPISDCNLAKGDHLEIQLPDELSDVNSIEAPINIIYEDDYILIINKPHNLACIGTKRHYEHHLSGIIMNYYKNKDIRSTIHLVNRLDYETQGLVLVAKHQYIHGLFSKVNIIKKYRFWCKGKVDEHGIIKNKIEKDSNDPKKRKICDTGKLAITEYRLLNYENDLSYVEAILHTGRTHQIRLHFSDLGHPLVGDILYGSDIKMDRILLQSYYLGFMHPILEDFMEFSI